VKRKLLISGVTLGACVLTVSVIMSGAPSVIVSPTPEATPQVVDMAASAPSESDRQTSTDTDQIIVAFTAAPSNLSRAAKAAVGPIAATQVGAGVVSVNPITKHSAAVTLDITLSRTQASRIAKAVEATVGVDYAEASVNFYPNGDSDWVRWNLSQIKLDQLATTDTSALKPIVVGVIDTGVADNADLPKALLVNSLDGVIWGKSVSGTAWSTATVHLTYTDDSDAEQQAAITPEDDGTWTYDMRDNPAKDGTPLTAWLVDASNNTGDPVTLTVDAAVSLTVPSPINSYTVTGTTDAVASVVIANQDGPVCETVAESHGSFTCTVDEALGDGSYTVTATDPLGNVSDPATVVIDTVAPDAPTLRPSSGATISGTAEADATITLTYPDDSTQQTIADGNGDWTITPTVTLNHGDTVTAVATDAAGNTSAESTPLVIDREAPPAPTIDPNPGDGRSIVVTDVAAGDTASLRSTSTDAVPAGEWSHSDGTWTFTPQSRLNENPHLEVVLTDEAGNVSEPTEVLVDTTAPELAVVSPSRGETLSGTAEAGATITLTYPDGSTQQTIADGNGEWTITPTVTLTHGDTVTAVATDAVGNPSDPQQTITIDQEPPSLAVVSPSRGDAITGTAEAAARVTLTYPDQSTQQTTADSNGDWSVEPSATLSDGDTVTVTATDAAGNVSPERTVSIDRRAPELSVSATDGTTVSGTSEVDAAITITYTDVDDSSHTVHTTVGEGGTWTATLDPVAADRSTVAVTAADALGNESDPISRTVHYGPPSAPVVDASDGNTVVVRGVASGDVPSLVDGAGDPVDLAGTDNNDGSWTFTPAERLSESDELYAVATDDDGVSSELSAQIVIDTTAPVIDAADVVVTSESLTGPANSDLASLTISYQDTDGHDRTATATVETSGWSAILDPAAQAGSQATLTATDSVGNESTLTVDVPAATASPDPSPSPSDDPVTPASESSSTPTPTATTTPGAESQESSSASESSQTGTVLPGYDFYSGDDDATDGPNDASDYHGTHVAGIIASDRSDGYHTQGVAAGVKILPIKVFGGKKVTLPDDSVEYVQQGVGTDKIAQAIRWGAGLSNAGADRENAYPAKVLNLSLGARNTPCPQTLQDAIDEVTAQGTLVVVSAGNDNRSIAQQSPANCKNVVVVTATTATGGRASYSNWGTSASSSSWLVAAPGGSGTGSCADASTSYGWVFSTGAEGYLCMAGTSQAAPHVAGVAARMLAVDSTLRPADLATIIRGTSTPLADGCPTGTCGSGIVNAEAAVAAASRFNPDSGGTDPVVVPPVKFPQVTTRFSGTLRTGYTQTASTSTTYSSGTLSYQWYRNGTAISGAHSRTYTLTPSDYGTRLSLTVTDTFGDRASASTSATVAPGYISSLAKPKILGTRKVGTRLRATKGSWSVPTTVYRYKWYRNGKKIKGATSRKYKLTWRDRRKRITVRVYVKSTGYYNHSRLSGKTASIR
jgi:Subtilase family/Bacterial Ig domain